MRRTPRSISRCTPRSRLCVFRVLLRPSIPPVVAALCALLFALHPVTIGPSLWWSARFDLLSTLFVLMAINAGIRYRERVTSVPLMCALLAAFAAMLSKENGLAVVVALTLIWGRWIFSEPAQRKKAAMAIASAWMLAALFLFWRRWVLGTFSSDVTGPVPMAEATQHGLLVWARDAAGYLSFFPHMTTASIGLVARRFGHRVGCADCVAVEPR